MHVLHSVPLLKHFEHCSKILTSVRVIALVQSRVAITTGYCDPVWMFFFRYIYVLYFGGQPKFKEFTCASKKRVQVEWELSTF